ncbi:GTPase [Streptomyces globosus]|uniref:GTPase n=1 Tax=Streptomyces globosus TaxID=68209 RepID=UPI0038301517
MDEARLAEAAAAAVAASAPLARQLSLMAEELTRAVGPGPEPGREPGPPSAPGPAPDTPYAHLLAEDRRLRTRAAELLGELTGTRLSAMDTFNVVLFGRTGVGKSSLVEALTGGDGRRISPGRTDHTTRVEEVRWAGLRLFDTPGTNGWGHDGDNSELEEQARRAVLTADLVLLCFDDGSQLEGEFAKIAAWVLAYRKPAVVVLNCVERPWRDPGMVSQGVVRARLSATVAEHAAHIRDWLAACGLPAVPLVALSAQRAVAARGAGDYQGWDARAVRRMRERDGRARLLGWSNLPVLEGLVAEAVRVENAPQLRLGGLVGQMSGALTGVAAELRTQLAKPALAYAETVETGLAAVLTVLGAPTPEPPPATGTARPDGAGDTPGDDEAGKGEAGEDEAGGEEAAAHRRAVALLAELETLRGGPFPSPARGEARAHLDNLLTARLGTLRTAMETRAEEHAERAFRNRVELSAKEFTDAVVRPDEITEAVGTAVADFTAYVRRRIDLAVADTAADLQEVGLRLGAVHGGTASGMRTMGKAAGYGSAAAGLLGAALAIGVGLNWWNPIGWAGALALTASGTGFAGRLLSRFGLRREQIRRDAARIDQRTRARRAVADHIEALRTHVTAHCEQIIRTAVLAKAAPGIEQAVVLRRIAAAAARDAALVQQAAAALPAAREPADLLLEAASRAEAAAGITHPADADLHWLGASWCTDPYNLAAPAPARPGGRSGAAPRFGPGVFRRLRAALRPGRRLPAPGSGAQWLALLHRELAGDTRAAPVLAELDALAADPRPRIAVAGDMSTGKSAFIRRLLVESGSPVPASLRSSAGPETFRAEAYAWEGMLLVDTPGFQSGLEPHTQAARAALADAAAVFYLFPPHAAAGDRADLDLVLRGRPEEGRFPKSARALYVINKIDRVGGPDLGADFAARIERAEAALASLLEGIAPPAPGQRPYRERIVPMAAAPFQLRADHGSAYDDFRSWDGFRDFASAVRELRLTLEADAADVTLLHGGAARLAGLRARAEEEAGLLARKLDELGRLAQEASHGAATGRAMVKALTQGAARLADDFTSRLVLEAMEPGLDPVVRKARGERLEKWGADAEFTAMYDLYRAEADRTAQNWLAAVSSALDRRTRSPRFALAFPDGIAGVDLRFLAADALRARARDLLSATGAAVAPVDRLTPDDVVRFAAHFDVLLAPDQIEAALHLTSDAGIFLKVLNAVSTISAMNSLATREQKTEAARQALRDVMRASAKGWAARVRDSAAAAETLCTSLEATADELTARQAEVHAELKAARDRAGRYTAALHGAAERLGVPMPNRNTRGRR